MGAARIVGCFRLGVAPVGTLALFSGPESLPKAPSPPTDAGAILAAPVVSAHCAAPQPGSGAQAPERVE
jgi:hypothetical protein